jgi:hypothetical protein
MFVPHHRSLRTASEMQCIEKRLVAGLNIRRKQSQPSAGGKSLWPQQRGSELQHRQLPWPPGALLLLRSAAKTAVKVFMAGSSRCQQDALARILTKSALRQIVGTESKIPLDATPLSGKGADVLLLGSCGNWLEDLALIREVRASQPDVEIVLLGDTASHTHGAQNAAPKTEQPSWDAPR